jgi:hydrogenase maturation protease
MKSISKKLIIGIGNESRGDDGLGWAFLKALEKGNYPDWQFIVRYQLNVEDADLIKEADTVVFVDSYNGKLDKGFLLEECHARVDFEYTTHALNPCAVLALCNNLYNHKPLNFVMKIQGYEWGLGKGLSMRAKENLDKALVYFGRKFEKLDLA